MSINCPQISFLNQSLASGKPVDKRLTVQAVNAYAHAVNMGGVGLRMSRNSAVEAKA
jgi:hypothetical protein